MPIDVAGAGAGTDAVKYVPAWSAADFAGVLSACSDGMSDLLSAMFQLQLSKEKEDKYVF